ncbi:methyltransferase RsmF C-terminal domain-like protein [Pirellulaceae bacterium SH467]
MIELAQVLPPSEHELFHGARQNYPSRAIRIRDDRIETGLPFETEQVPWYARGRWLSDFQVRPATFLNYGIADYYIQDAGSFLPIALLDPKPGEWILDLCAAPGGKASAILEAMQGSGLLVANETIRGRLDSLQYMLARTGHANYVVSNQDPEDLSQALSGRFDAILVDAPCSGQMLVARDKRDENAWSQKQVLHSAKRQNRILDAAVRMLKPGGRLVYSTCTFAVEEDEDQLSRLTTTWPGRFEPLESVGLTPWQSPLAKGCYRLWPHRDRCAGGFAGGLVLKDSATDWEEGGNGERKRVAKGKGLRGHPKEERDVLQTIAPMGDLSSDLELRLWSGELSAASSDVWRLLDRFHWLGAPMTAAYRKGTRWLPSHALAMLRPTWFQPKRSVELDSDRASVYLRGEVVALRGESPDLGIGVRSAEEPGEAEGDGWHVARWRNCPMGWAKGVSNRWNNHLPAWAVMNSIEDRT